MVQVLNDRVLKLKNEVGKDGLMAIKKKSLQIEGMTGSSCELRINNSLQKVRGIIKASAHYPIHAVFIEYDLQQLSWQQLDRQLERLGYHRIETTDTVTFSIPETACPTIRQRVRSLFSDQPWIENVECVPNNSSVSVSFDSRAWSAQDILQMITQFGYQPSVVV